MLTVVELPEFIRRSKKLLAESELNDLIDYLATHPMAGVLIQGTGGIRKLDGNGKEREKAQVVESYGDRQ